MVTVTARVLAMVLAVVTGTGQAPDLADDDTPQEVLDANITGPGEYLGGVCEGSCHPRLLHAYCDPQTSTCECERKYPVKLGALKGCAKPAQLGDQCFYYKTCSYADQNSECVQVQHNAICQCKQGFHEVTVARPTKRVFCSQDILVVTTDTSTLLGVATGLAIFTALICFVLKLFVGDQPRHYANANLAPPILFASDTGIPLTVHNLRPGSRASSDRSDGGFSYSQRGSRGVVVPASRAGAARAAAILLISCHLEPDQTQEGSRVLSLASVHSTSSVRSFSARRYEREKEQRLAAQRARQITPSPRSTDQLLEGQSHEMSEWTNKGSDNTLDATESGTSETELPLQPLSSSMPEYSQHNVDWPPAHQ